ncbi:MAG: ABC transporter permease [Anaerolineae bacterium]|nr:ABC transporter permease [Anaerolineae bacterium]
MNRSPPHPLTPSPCHLSSPALSSSPCATPFAKGRLALTLGTLILATAIFVSVFSVRDSLTGTLQDSLRYWSYDIEVTLAQPQSEERALNEVQQVPGVLYAEAWSNDTVRRVREDKTESRNISVIAVPGESKLIQPILVAGRWLQPDDENAIVINADVLADEPDLKVGDVVALKFGQRQFPFQIVGIAQSTLTGQVATRARCISRAGAIAAHWACHAWPAHSSSSPSSTTPPRRPPSPKRSTNSSGAPSCAWTPTRRLPTDASKSLFSSTSSSRFSSSWRPCWRWWAGWG